MERGRGRRRREAGEREREGLDGTPQDLTPRSASLFTFLVGHLLWRGDKDKKMSGKGSFSRLFPLPIRGVNARIWCYYYSKKNGFRKFQVNLHSTTTTGTILLTAFRSLQTSKSSPFSLFSHRFCAHTTPCDTVWWMRGGEAGSGRTQGVGTHTHMEGTGGCP